MTILVLGSSGQIASHLRESLPEAVFWGRDEIDLAVDPGALLPAAGALRPTLIINAAAYTAVDKAEQERERSWNLNAAAPAAAAKAAATLDVPLLHFSTDYVFDGSSASPYAVGDAVGPINVYGKTKLAGEIAVRTLCPKHWIIRTSWVFSEYGANFVKTIIRLARGGDRLRVVADQYGRPTYAGDLAALAQSLASSPATLSFGTYHAVGGPSTTWHGFAEIIVARAHQRALIPHCAEVTAISTADYRTAARRPANSVLEPSVELQHAGVLLDWEHGLDRTLSRL